MLRILCKEPAERCLLPGDGGDHPLPHLPRELLTGTSLLRGTEKQLLPRGEAPRDAKMLFSLREGHRGASGERCETTGRDRGAPGVRAVPPHATPEWAAAPSPIPGHPRYLGTVSRSQRLGTARYSTAPPGRAPEHRPAASGAAPPAGRSRGPAAADILGPRRDPGNGRAGGWEQPLCPPPPRGLPSICDCLYFFVRVYGRCSTREGATGNVTQSWRSSR